MQVCKFGGFAIGEAGHTFCQISSDMALRETRPGRQEAEKRAERERDVWVITFSNLLGITVLSWSSRLILSGGSANVSVAVYSGCFLRMQWLSGP